MDISFKNRRFAEQCNKQRVLRKKQGLVRAKKIAQRLSALQAAETLSDMAYLPGRCHELKGDHTGLLALDLDHPYWLADKS